MAENVTKDVAFRAMAFARTAHALQRRKYTNTPYSDHLAEVAGIVSTVSESHPDSQITAAVAWLHDCVEDQGVTRQYLESHFGQDVADGVMLLSDMEVGNRAERKAASRRRLAGAPAWVQDIKVADLISNTASIAEHDPKFAVVYLEEKRLLLEVLKLANPSLLKLAGKQISPQGLFEPSAQSYNLKRIAWELERTAMGDGYFGNALRVAKDFAFLSDLQRGVLDAYASGSTKPTDHIRLQEIAMQVYQSGMAEPEAQVVTQERPSGC